VSLSPCSRFAPVKVHFRPQSVGCGVNLFSLYCLRLFWIAQSYPGRQPKG